MRDENVPNLIPRRYLGALVASLQKEAEQEQVKLPPDAARYIACNVRLNARALKDALRPVLAYSSLTGTEITLATTQRALQSFIEEQGEIALDSVPEVTSQPFGAKKAKVRFHSPIAVENDFVLCLLEGRAGGKTSRVRCELQVNMRESERERLAKRDVYERELERRAKRGKLG